MGRHFVLTVGLVTAWLSMTGVPAQASGLVANEFLTFSQVAWGVVQSQLDNVRRCTIFVGALRAGCNVSA